MNPIRTVRRLACMLTCLAAALAAAVMGAPAAFAATWPSPPPGVLSRYETVLVPHTVPAHTHAAITGGLAGWQITLIAAAAVLLAAVLAVTAYRIWATRRRVTASNAPAQATTASGTVPR